MPENPLEPPAPGSNCAVDAGLYQLIIRLPRRSPLSPGRLGTFQLPRGFYIYTGSARRNLRPRIARHLRTEKRLRWHVDYLLQYGIIRSVPVYPLHLFTECELNLITLRALNGEFPVPGFGASDCRCVSHLIRPPAGLGAREIEKAVGAATGVVMKRPERLRGAAGGEINILWPNLSGG